MEATVDSNEFSLQKEKFYDIKTIFGARDREINEVYCRALVELLNNDSSIIELLKSQNIPATYNPFRNKPLVLSLALKPMENEEAERKQLKQVLNSVKSNLSRIA